MTAAAFERVSARDRTRDDLYQLIVTRSPLTRPELAQITGMSRTTINQAVGRLLADGSIVEADHVDKGRGSGSGRPASRLSAVARGLPVAGIDFGHTHIQVALADSLGAILGERCVHVDVDLHASDALDTAAALLAELRELHGVDRLSSVVAGIPGPIDTATGLVTTPTILSGWVARAPAQELERRLGMAVHIENDAVLGAVGELRGGSARGLTDFLYVKASHGIGASLVIAGQPYRGSAGIAGEIGHTRLAAQTELCRCGSRGCLEAVISVQGLRAQIAQTHPGLDPELITLTDPPDDDITARILDEAGRLLGRVLSPMCDLLNPQALVIGGELGSTRNDFIAGVQSSIERYSMSAISSAMRVEPASLSVRAELVGAVELASARAAVLRR